MVFDRVFRAAVLRRPTLKLAVAVATVVLLLVRPAGADHPSHEVWLISTRQAPSCGSVEQAEQRIKYRRLGEECRWLEADAAAFFEAADPEVPTTVFIHGNRSSANAAVRDGWRVYRGMCREARERPFRLVIWSWPADRIPGRIRRDVQIKAARSDVQSYYLARCLRRMDRRTPVCLIGYSFGARAITGALHILGGGRLDGRSLPEPVEPDQPALRRAVLVACASDADWLSPGRRNALALSQVDSILITRNGRDQKLRWYPRMYRRGGPGALGYVGPAGCGLSEKIELIDVSCSVGRAHSWACYEPAPELRSRLARYVFLEPSETPQPKATDRTEE